MKQVPYTMTKQVSFDIIATQLLALTASLSLANEETRLLTTVTSAFLASILACIASQPGDVLLTKTFKGENGRDSPIENAMEIYEKQGVNGFYTGFSARLAHVASIVTSQLVIYDFLKQLLGLPSTGS